MSTSTVKGHRRFTRRQRVEIAVLLIQAHLQATAGYTVPRCDQLAVGLSLLAEGRCPPEKVMAVTGLGAMLQASDPDVEALATAWELALYPVAVVTRPAPAVV